MYSSIRIRKDILMKLKEIGKKSETYDDVFLRLIKFYEDNN